MTADTVTLAILIYLAARWVMWDVAMATRAHEVARSRREGAE